MFCRQSIVNALTVSYQPLNCTVEYRKQQFLTYEEFTRQFPCDYSMPFARGGHGELYRGIDTETNDEVAIKRRLYTVGDDALSLEKEYINTQEVPTNRFIVRYLYYGRYATPFGTYEYLVMRYYRDGNLTNNVLPWHQLSDVLQRRFVEEFLLGLNHLHNHKIVHRDIKPENVLLVRYAEQQNSAYRPILADFGISKVLAENPEIARTLVQNSMRVGTVTYMAPEQLRGDRVTYNSDLWSFGIILYEIITRKHMIARRSFSEQQREEAYGFWRNVDEERFPEDLSMVAQPYQELIRRCLVVNPKLRVRRAIDLIDLMNQPLPVPTPVIVNGDAPVQRPADKITEQGSARSAAPEKLTAEAVEPTVIIAEMPTNDVARDNGQHQVIDDEPESDEPIPEGIEVVPLSQLTMQLTEQWDEPVLKKEEPKPSISKREAPTQTLIVNAKPVIEVTKAEMLHEVVPPLSEPADPVLPPVSETPTPTQPATGKRKKAKAAPVAGMSIEQELPEQPIVKPAPAPDEPKPVSGRPIDGAAELKPVNPIPVPPANKPEAVKPDSEDFDAIRLKPDDSEEARPEPVELSPVDVRLIEPQVAKPKHVPPLTALGPTERSPTERSLNKRRVVNRRRAAKALKNRSASVVNSTFSAIKERWQTVQMPRHRWPARLLLTGLVLISLTVGVYSSGPGLEEIASTGPTLQQSESYIVALQRFNRYRADYQKTGALHEYLWTFIHCNPTYEDSLVDSGVQRAGEMLKINQAVFPAYQGNPSGLKRQEMKRLVLNKISWESRPHETDELSCQPRN